MYWSAGKGSYCRSIFLQAHVRRDFSISRYKDVLAANVICIHCHTRLSIISPVAIARIESKQNKELIIIDSEM